ncbi:SUKH-4 family immunity protein [Streptomyces sp. NPDC017413]|uniref:SUKH-4 family immunity protein n=2 Tax=Streptomyces TaxID=1883 RepID=UPI00378DD507
MLRHAGPDGRTRALERGKLRPQGYLSHEMSLRSSDRGTDSQKATRSSGALRSCRGAVPDACRRWLVLGLFADTTLALDPERGTVYFLGEGEEGLVPTPVHRDVESLVYALTKFEALCRRLRNDDERTEERVDALRGEITSFDPLPFADEDSPWRLAFEEVVDGIW